MADWLARFVASILVTYAVSRGLRRVPLAMAEPRRSLFVHAFSTLVVCLGVYALRQSGAALVAPLIAQGCWLLLDIVREGGVRARAG